MIPAGHLVPQDQVLRFNSVPAQARQPLASMKLIYGMLHHIHLVIQTVI